MVMALARHSSAGADPLTTLRISGGDIVRAPLVIFAISRSEYSKAVDRSREVGGPNRSILV
jgi:hypothetical protein